MSDVRGPVDAWFLSAFVAVMVLAVSGTAQASIVTFKGNDMTVHRGHVGTAPVLVDQVKTEADLDACVAAGDLECMTNLIKELGGDEAGKRALLTLRAAEGAKTLAASDPAKALTVLSTIMDLASEMTSTEDNTTAVKISKVAADVIAKSDVQAESPEAVGKLAGKTAVVVLKPSILFGDEELAKEVVKSVTSTAKKDAIKAAYPDAVKEIKAALKEAQSAYTVREMYPDMLEFHKVLFPEEEKPVPESPSKT